MCIWGKRTPNLALHEQRMNKQENPQIEDMCIWGNNTPNQALHANLNYISEKVLYFYIRIYHLVR